MKGRKKKIVKMLTDKKLISVSINSQNNTTDSKVRTKDLEILKQIVDDVSDIENTRSDNEINELLQKKERSLSAGRNYDGDIVKYESVVCLDDSSKLCPESELRKEKVKKSIDEVRSLHLTGEQC